LQLFIAIIIATLVAILLDFLEDIKGCLHGRELGRTAGLGHCSLGLEATHYADSFIADTPDAIIAKPITATPRTRYRGAESSAPTAPKVINKPTNARIEPFIYFSLYESTRYNTIIPRNRN
jgi:hypothetical protein